MKANRARRREGEKARGRSGVRGLRLIVAGLVSVSASEFSPLWAQDTVRVGITYQPGVRPGLVVLPAPGLDSIQSIIARDLDYSDRFEVIPLSPSGSVSGSGSGKAPINYAFWRGLGAALAVELSPASGTFVRMRLYDLAAERVGGEVVLSLDQSGVGDARMPVHALADEIVRMVTGQLGVAATRLLFLNHDDKRIWRVDSDGAGLVAVTPAGIQVMSATWSPDGSKIAYTQFGRDGSKPLVVQSLGTGTRSTLPTTTKQNITPAFSPDGKSLLYAGMSETGTSLYVLNAQDLCCVERLSTGRFAENFSPAYSPDGRRVVFVSTRAGGQQIYAMSADGTDQELLVPFDYGETGPSNAPEWSPDGTTIAFHREVSRVPQVWIWDLAGRRAKQLSSFGRNEDPSWAPDSRHLVFISDRTGRRQLFVVDTETNRVRQIMTPVTARLPAWSRTLTRSH